MIFFVCFFLFSFCIRCNPFLFHLLKKLYSLIRSFKFVINPSVRAKLSGDELRVCIWKTIATLLLWWSCAYYPPKTVRVRDTVSYYELWWIVDCFKSLPWFLYFFLHYNLWSLWLIFPLASFQFYHILEIFSTPCDSYYSSVIPIHRDMALLLRIQVQLEKHVWKVNHRTSYAYSSCFCKRYHSKR